MQLILLGPPGSGKGTLATDLARMYDIPHISTGDIFRQMIREQTSLGKKAKQYIDGGKLVPDELTISMVRERLSQKDCQDGFMLDGFPRTIPQANAFDEILAENKRRLSAVLNVLVPEDLIIYRLSGRRLCQGCGRGFNVHTDPPQKEGLCDDCGDRLVQRKDDQSETVQKRLATYRQQTQPLIEFYQKRGLIVDVDNSGKIGENLDDVDRDLKKKLKEDQAE